MFISENVTGNSPFNNYKINNNAGVKEKSISKV